jgi:hypothetical protein
MQIVATNGAKNSTLEICKADRAKPQSALAMTFSWAEAHDCFCDHFQVLYRIDAGHLSAAVLLTEAGASPIAIKSTTRVSHGQPTLALDQRGGA